VEVEQVLKKLRNSWLEPKFAIKTQTAEEAEIARDLKVKLEVKAVLAALKDQLLETKFTNNIEKVVEVELEELTEKNLMFDY